MTKPTAQSGTPHIQIAIDGPAASGKSTVARLVAKALGGYYVNTGDMYRAVTWLALQNGIDCEREPDALVKLLDSGAVDIEYRRDQEGNPVLTVNGSPAASAAIRSPEVARSVSFTARIPGVRDWLRERQRATRRFGIIVMEGRDIGTVILPDATHKFFLTASPEVRARRRLAQAGETAPGATVDSVAAEIAERDRIDSMRPVAPLRVAADAVVINTDTLTAEDVAACITDAVRSGGMSCEQ